MIDDILVKFARQWYAGDSFEDSKLCLAKAKSELRELLAKQIEDNFYVSGSGFICLKEKGKRAKVVADISDLIKVVVGELLEGK